MISYYTWNILLTFILGFGFVSSFFLLSEYIKMKRNYLEMKRVYDSYMEAKEIH